MQKFLKKWALCTKDAEGNEKVHPVPILVNAPYQVP